MILKLLLISFVSITFSLASYEKVRIGTIDSYYNNSLSKAELRAIIEEIEDKFESQLGFNVFDYSNSGKPIDILYVPPLKLEKRIDEKLLLLKKTKNQLENNKNDFASDEKIVLKKQKILNNKTKNINKEIKSLNNYIKNANRKKNVTQSEYNKIKSEIDKKQQNIKTLTRNLKNEQKVFQKEFKTYNRQVSSYNKLINKYNRLYQDINRLNRSVKQVKGKTFGLQEISLKTSYKDGRKIKEKIVTRTMSKIEIYGFETKEQLKAVLAHEIGHLVGIPHIRKKNALMHPILQENQIEFLHLTKDDIRNFKKNF